ncbi:MAG: hypothetical protein ACE5GC_09415, partial [Acidimicrobiia bacterium]
RWRVGGLRILGATDDGTTVLVREEVIADISAVAPTEVHTTVEGYGPDARFLGSARFPTDRQYISSLPGLFLDADGRVPALTAAPDHVAVIELEPVPFRITAAMDLAA